jgi:uncharacterized membrane protein YedE/YeeE
VIAALTGMQPSKSFNLVVAALFASGMLFFVLKSKDLRGSSDNMLAGLAIGAAVVIAWYITGGAPGQAWKEYADMATDVPSRVQVQSYTFISPMGDFARYLLDPGNPALLNFGVMALVGVIAGSFAYALVSGTWRIEWFASFGDFVNHAIGGVLMGVGGVLSMGCTVGQAITGISTLALGSIATFVAIVIGAVVAMKYQYWRMLREA